MVATSIVMKYAISPINVVMNFYKENMNYCTLTVQMRTLYIHSTDVSVVPSQYRCDLVYTHSTDANVVHSQYRCERCTLTVQMRMLYSHSTDAIWCTLAVQMETLYIYRHESSYICSK